jgi:hypothetical protein
MRRGAVSFANFVCTFGSSGGLMDYDFLTIPAFTTDTFVRKYGKTQFHLYDVKILNLGENEGVPVIGIAGHFVKNTILTREQIFNSESGLVRNNQKMESAPSAYFLLVLNTHKLIYFAETNHCPDISSFGSTIESFIKRLRESHLRDEYEMRKGATTLKKLSASIPRPTVTIVPLTEREKITEYVQRFAKIDKLRLRLIRPNHETDASEVVASVRERFGEMEPDRLDITASRSDGLNVDGVTKVVEEAAESANTDIEISGEDSDGTRLKGQNDQFALTTELEHPSNDDRVLANQLFSVYNNFRTNGKIKAKNAIDHVADKIRHLATMI